MLHLAGILFPHINDDARSKSHQIHALLGFEHIIPASERSQTHDLDRAAIGIGQIKNMNSDKELAAINEFTFLFIPRMTSEGCKKNKALAGASGLCEAVGNKR